MNPYAIREAQRLMARSEQYNMTVREAREWLATEHSVGVWAGSPEGELMRSYHSDMNLCARYAVWVHELVQNAIQEMES